ncbi:MAG: ABC transporter ATP-binding protein [Acutalibacteraceae bacterium]|jgi:spermidine/putrescine transport system ATP-binding protein|nr:ABC transporter ATP-binding protein [Acutalibacteraceae bacterium]HJB61913.1 ABC transporter ATP-binding protein [Candidatus Ruminococcus gallistercoris]
MDEILELKGIKKAFGGVPVLNGIDLKVEPGEFITLLGSSGCGKTTTLRIISGLEVPDSGTVLLEGADVTNTEPDKRGVHTVFQNYALFPHMTVEANIGYSLRIRGVKKPEIKSRVREMLELVQLEGFGSRMPGELSGGQRQRVAIARSVIDSPKVLLLDEPLGALDLQLRRMMQTELKRLQKKLGITFIYITHDQEEALNMSDRIAVMRDGLFEQLGTPNEIYDRPKTAFVARFVGSANILTLGGKCLAVRSEALELQRGEPGYLTGVIREKTFAGGMLRITVDTKECGELVASRHGIDSPLMPGDTVGLTWADGAAVEVEP